MKYISYNLVSVLLILISAYMIYADKDYWGLVMLAGILTSVTPSYTSSKEKSSISNNKEESEKEVTNGN